MRVSPFYASDTGSVAVKYQHEFIRLIDECARAQAVKKTSHKTKFYLRKKKLHPIDSLIGTEGMCVPSIFVPLTGASYSQITACLNVIRKKPLTAKVSGVSDFEITKLLKAFGFRFTKTVIKKKMNMWEFFQQRAKPDVLYLVSQTCHVSLLRNGWVMDNRSAISGEISVHRFRTANLQVETVFELGK